MSEDQTAPSWVDRVRRWLWLDGPQRTDNSEAHRGFYLNRKPVGWRFLLVVTALGIAIGLVLLNVRDAEARADVDSDRPGTAVATTVWTASVIA
jgi:hypothetical protein